MSKFFKMLRSPAVESEVPTLPEEGIIPQEEQLQEAVAAQVEEAEKPEGEAQISADSPSSPGEVENADDAASVAPVPDEATDEVVAEQAPTDLAEEAEEFPAEPTPEQEQAAEQEEETVRAIITLEEMVAAVEASAAGEYNKATESVLINQLKRAGLEAQAKGRSDVLASAKKHIASSKSAAKHKQFKLAQEGISDFVKNLFSKKGDAKSKAASPQELVASFDAAAAAAKLKEIVRSPAFIEGNDLNFKDACLRAYDTDGFLPVSVEVGIFGGDYANTSEVIGNESLSGAEILSFVKTVIAEQKKGIAFFNKIAGSFGGDVHSALFNQSTDIKAGNYAAKLGYANGKIENGGGALVTHAPDLEENRLISKVKILAPAEVASFYKELLSLAETYAALAKPWSAYIDKHESEDSDDDEAYSFAYDMFRLFSGEYLGYAVKKTVAAGIDLVQDSIAIYNHVMDN